MNGSKGFVYSKEGGQPTLETMPAYLSMNEACPAAHKYTLSAFCLLGCQLPNVPVSTVLTSQLSACMALMTVSSSFSALSFIFYANLLALLSQSYDLLPDHLILLSAFFLLGWQLLAKVLNRSSNMPTSWEGCLSASQLLHQHHTRRMIVKPIFETLADNWLTQLLLFGQGTLKYTAHSALVRSR